MDKENQGSAVPPQWLEDLNMKIEEKQKRKLAHDAGAGAACLSCKHCPGLDLHFWRKCCKLCKCSKDLHDVKVDEFAKYGLLLQDKQNERRTNQSRSFMLQNEDFSKVTNLLPPGAKPGTHMELSFDWIPDKLDKNTVFEYMNLLPKDKAPISDSKGGLYRKQQWNRQIPDHDINQNLRNTEQQADNTGFTKFLDKVRTKVVGQAEVLRLGEAPKIVESESYGTQHPQNTSALTAKQQSPFFKLRTTETGLVGPLGPNNEVPTPRTALKSLPQQISGLDLKLPRHFLNPSRHDKRNVCQTLFPSDPASTTSAQPVVDDLAFLNNFQDQCNLGEVESYQDIANANKAETNEENANKVLDKEENANTKTMAPAVPVACHSCKKRIEIGTLAVQVKKANLQMYWHPACFVCDTCNELLVDLFYFFHKGFVYCLRHYAEAVDISRCHACDELLFGSYTRADDKDYHVEHFCCFNCDRPLADENYLLMTDQPWCLPCYNQVYAKTCRACHLKIRPNEKSVALKDKYWHLTDECYKCCSCNMPLVHAKQLLMSKENCPDNLYCSVSCKESFEENMILSSISLDRQPKWQ